MMSRLDHLRLRRTAPLSGEAPPPPLAAGRMEMAAAALGALWLIAIAGAVFLGGGLGGGAVGGGGLEGGGGGFFAALAGIMVVVMPIAVIVMVAATARHVRALRVEAAGLRAEMAHLGLIRRTATPHGSVQAGPAEASLAETVVPALPRNRVRSEPRLADTRPAEPRQAPAPPPPPPLPPPTQDDAEPITAEDYIVALNFPDSPDDAEGVRALRQVLADEGAAKLIRAAQDVLTLLAQDAIFIDDLPDTLHPAAVWRRFAQGEGGSGLTGDTFADTPAFDWTARRMSEDQVFHDAAHHFLRQFDRNLAPFTAAASDAEVEAMGTTRTARAFLLVGEVAGTFA